MSENTPFILEHVPCNFCGSDRYTVRYRKPDNWLWLNQYEFPVVECVECGLVYVNPRPTLEGMARYYPGDYHDERSSEKFVKKYHVQLEFVPALTNERVLDVGCARGDWLHFLKNRYSAIECHGVDYYSEGVAYLDIRFCQNKLTGCGFEPAMFDLVTAWSVLEHLHAPGDYFAEIARILKPGGRFVFLVPNAESLYGRRAYKEDTPRHLYHFSEKTLTAYAAKYGFEFADCVYDNRVWDGRGHGTFYYGLLSLFGVNWETIYFKKIGWCRRLIGRLGILMDRVVFKYQWEARLRKSGTMICTFIKPPKGALSDLSTPTV